MFTRTPSRKPLAARSPHQSPHPLLYLLLLTLTAPACAAQRVYALPPKMASQAEYAADPLVACATVRNYQAERDGYQVKIYFDDERIAQYNLDPYATQTLALTVNEKQLTPIEADRAYDDIKRKSDELYACALNPSAYNAEASEPAAVAGAPAGAAMMMDSSMGDVSPVGDSCQNLSACYNDIAASVCRATDAECRAHYTMSDDIAADPAKCQQTLNNIPTMVRALQEQRPGFVIPSSCSVEQGGAAPAPAPAAGLPGYQGTWQARLTYSYSCGNDPSRSYDGKEQGTWTLKIDGDAGELKAQVQGSPAAFSLSGNGTPDSLRLCGAFPLRGKKNMTASPQVNNVCLVLDKGQSADVMQGRVEGAYYVDDQSCAINDASIELHRQP